MNKNNKPIALAVNEIGSQKKLAESVGVVQSCVWKWLHSESKIPLDKAIIVEEVTNGKVRCEDLRPDVNWAVLRKRG